MICRNFIAPKRAFTQLSNELIRHPRLSSDAVRLLTWQLSLPPNARESLSKSAERAGIGGSAFTRAKRQLTDEGFVHDRRVQVGRGRWVTQQLISSVPLSQAEAHKILAKLPLPQEDTTERVAPPTSPQVAPSGRRPAVGGPGGPLTDGPSLQHREAEEGKTSNHPGDAAPTAEAEVERGAAYQTPGEDEPTVEPPQERFQNSPVSETQDAALPDAETVTNAAAPHDLLLQAEELVVAFPGLDPELRGIPRAMHPELTQLTLQWLQAGHSPAGIRTHILRALPDDGTPVVRPGGLLRYLLSDVAPVRTTRKLPTERESPPKTYPLRECEGSAHHGPTMFRPTQGESLCGACLGEIAASWEAGGR